MATARDNTTTLEHRGGDALHSDRTKIIITVNGGTTITFDAVSTDDTLQTGESATLNSNVEGTSTITGWTRFTPSGASSLNPGDTVTIQLIDTESEKLIYEREVTAN